MRIDNTVHSVSTHPPLEISTPPRPQRTKIESLHQPCTCYDSFHRRPAPMRASTFRIDRIAQTTQTERPNRWPSERREDRTEKTVV